MGKIVLDLHDVFNDGEGIESALRTAVDRAIEKKIPLLEIIPGKGSGQLRKTVIRFFQRKEIRDMYHRLEMNEKNHGKMYVHFRF